MSRPVPSEVRARGVMTYEVKSVGEDTVKVLLEGETEERTFALDLVLLDDVVTPARVFTLEFEGHISSLGLFDPSPKALWGEGDVAPFLVFLGDKRKELAGVSVRMRLEFPEGLPHA